MQNDPKKCTKKVGEDKTRNEFAEWHVACLVE